MTQAGKFFVTVGKNPYGAAFSRTGDDAIALAKQAKREFPQSDVVAWFAPKDKNGWGEPFEIWENENTKTTVQVLGTDAGKVRVAIKQDDGSDAAQWFEGVCNRISKASN